MRVLSEIGVLISIVLLISGETLRFGVLLFLSFLISPLGIPAIAEWLIDKLHRLNSALRFFPQAKTRMEWQDYRITLGQLGSK